MSNTEEILTKYTEYMDNLEQNFPTSIEILKSEHKKIKSEILSQINSSSLPSNMEKKIESEFLKYLNRNDFAYSSQLNLFLSSEYNQIKQNIQNNKYQNIDDYIKDIKNLENKLLSDISAAPEGPNKILHINEFIYEQILEDCEIIINNHAFEYDNQFDKNKKEMDEILNIINEINEECQKIMMKIKEKENLIKQIEMDKKNSN